VNRTIALLGKELADLRQNITIFVPSFIVTVVAVFIPVFVAVIPWSAVKPADSSDLEVVLEIPPDPGAPRSEAAIQRSSGTFQMLVLGPVTSAMLRRWREENGGTLNHAG
jgi:hypothetical protein